MVGRCTNLRGVAELLSVTVEQSEIIARAIAEHQHAPYVTEMFPQFGAKGLWVGEHTLRPDRSFASKYLTRFLLARRDLVQGQKCLDVGSGSGVQALALACAGAEWVDAVDVSMAAVASTFENIERHRFHDRMRVHHGDLFGFEMCRDYDVIVFNHPFFRMSPFADCEFSRALMDDGGTLDRFFSSIGKILRSGGILVMPFSFTCGWENDPARYAEGAGLRTSSKYYVADVDGLHVIYVFYWGCRSPTGIA